MIPQTVMIGLIVAMVGYLLQQRAWRHNLQEEIRQREFEECLKLVDALGRAIDKRLMAISVFQSSVRQGRATGKDKEEYKASVKDWMHNFSSFKSKIHHYFGRGQMLTFENHVHCQLRTVSDIVLRTEKYGFSGLSEKHQKEFEHVISDLALARHKGFTFLLELNERIANEEVGRTALYNNIDVGSLDLISRVYLIQRLLGLKS
ncbi:hypothetical protein [Roseobacter litoralis]|uniref:hypothetical protein n=1 Tax=Roseobacter litoralis TaxID=42443 RepID=UPI002491525F|nr:hypothetical protein [Roseobacter litoralis]